MPEKGGIVYVSEDLIKRLKGHIFSQEETSNEKADDSAELEAASFCGAAYGIKIPNLSQNPVILNATGVSVPKLAPNTPISNVEFLTEVFPCGLDPIGVVRLVDSATENAEEDEDRLSQLLSYLPDVVLESNDPVILTRYGNGGNLNGYIQGEGGNLTKVEIKSLTREEIEKEITIIRVRGNLEVTCAQNETEISNAFKHLIEKVSCPYGTFQLENSDVFFIHTFVPKPKSNIGWVAGEQFEEEDAYDEDCIVTNLEALTIDDAPNDDDSDDEDQVDISRTKSINELWKLKKQEEEEDDGFGLAVDSAKNKSKKKIDITREETMDFRLLMKMSGDACTSRTLNCAPVVHYEKKKPFKSVRIPIKIDSLGYTANSTKIVDLMEVLKGCVQRQIHEMGRSVLSECRMRGTVSIPEAFHLKPDPFGHFVTIVYTKTGTCTNFAQFRRHLHNIFLLPMDRPYFRRMNRYTFHNDVLVKNGPLTNVHKGLEKGRGEKGGEVHLVDGTYTYHHYMQDKFDDDGWGCAYRSLQTLISWFRHQGYVETEVPTHQQIQKCLVDIEDKPKSFIGSKQWIGSTEVGFVLEKSCEVQSKFLSISSGDEMSSKGRELAHHFKTQGTPIMIGGGVLAHTILGVEWDEATGDTRWLILDPHFTGSDWDHKTGKPNIAHMQSKGWVGWKGPDFWVKTAFYNMCMPQRPKQW